MILPWQAGNRRGAQPGEIALLCEIRTSSFAEVTVTEEGYSAKNELLVLFEDIEKGCKFERFPLTGK